jgi:hypothetical protein
MSRSITVLRRVAAALAALGICLSLAACQTPLERAWGLSQRAHIAQSIANPDAGLQSREAPKTDGPGTDAALVKHRTHEGSVEKGEPPPVINVNTGG